MEEETRLMLRMLSAVRLYFEKARGEMDGEMGAQPRQAPVLAVLARHNRTFRRQRLYADHQRQNRSTRQVVYQSALLGGALYAHR